MKTERQGAEELVGEQIGEGHERPIVVGYALGAFESPHGAAEDPAEVSKAVDIWIFENLGMIVIDEGVGERVEVGQRCQQNRG